MPKVYVTHSREMADETVYFTSYRDGADELVYVVDSPEVADKIVYKVSSPELASPPRRTKVFVRTSYSPSPIPRYVVEDQRGRLFEFLGTSGGWAMRSPYIGSKMTLTELSDREASSVMDSFGIPRSGYFGIDRGGGR